MKIIISDLPNLHNPFRLNIDHCDWFAKENKVHFQHQSDHCDSYQDFQQTVMVHPHETSFEKLSLSLIVNKVIIYKLHGEPCLCPIS